MNTPTWVPLVMIYHLLLMPSSMGESGPEMYGYSVPAHQTISSNGNSKTGEGGGVGELAMAVTAARRTVSHITKAESYMLTRDLYDCVPGYIHIHEHRYPWPKVHTHHPWQHLCHG